MRPLFGSLPTSHLPPPTEEDLDAWRENVSFLDLQPGALPIHDLTRIFENKYPPDWWGWRYEIAFCLSAICRNPKNNTLNRALSHYAKAVHDATAGSFDVKLTTGTTHFARWAPRVVHPADEEEESSADDVDSQGRTETDDAKELDQLVEEAPKKPAGWTLAELLDLSPLEFWNPVALTTVLIVAGKKRKAPAADANDKKGKKAKKEKPPKPSKAKPSPRKKGAAGESHRIASLLATIRV